MGVAAYNEKCRAIVMRYSSEWEVNCILNKPREMQVSNDNKLCFEAKLHYQAIDSLFSRLETDA